MAKCLVCDNSECPGVEDPEFCPMAAQMLEGAYDETQPAHHCAGQTWPSPCPGCACACHD